MASGLSVPYLSPKIHQSLIFYNLRTLEYLSLNCDQYKLQFNVQSLTNWITYYFQIRKFQQEAL